MPTTVPGQSSPPWSPTPSVPSPQHPLYLTLQILGGIADTVAQVMTAVQRRRSAGDPMAIEFDDLEKKGVSATVDRLPDSRQLPPPFDFERLTRFMAYGFLIATVQHRWFSFLSAAFPPAKDAATVQALKCVALDQLIMAPVGTYSSRVLNGSGADKGVGLALFFLFMTVAEGGGRRAITRKFQDVYIPSLKANYMVWPAVQILNFRIVPLQFQIVRLSSSLCLG